MNMEPKSLNEWWDKQPDELKQAFTFLPDERWEEADLYPVSYTHLTLPTSDLV